MVKNFSGDKTKEKQRNELEKGEDSAFVLERKGEQLTVQLRRISNSGFNI